MSLVRPIRQGTTSEKWWAYVTSEEALPRSGNKRAHRVRLMMWCWWSGGGGARAGTRAVPLVRAVALREGMGVCAGVARSARPIVSAAWHGCKLRGGLSGSKA